MAAWSVMLPGHCLILLAGRGGGGDDALKTAGKQRDLQPEEPKLSFSLGRQRWVPEANPPLTEMVARIE